MARKENTGVGVPNGYREDAQHKTDVLWKVTIKGRKLLADNIPLHMSLRVFDDLDDKELKEVKEKVKEFRVETPDSKKLSFKTTIFYSKHTKKDYYMLKISGTDKSYEEFFNYFKNGHGFSHDKFMAHITIDKHLYDEINENGLEQSEIKFEDLTIEDGANNTVHSFGKSEDLEKGFKKIGAALGVVSALSAAPISKEPTLHENKPAVSQINPYNSKKMLNTIATVESQNGKYENHKPLGGIHAGESAIGKYGLTPNIIRETIHMNHGLRKKYGKAMNLRGDDMRRFSEDNPEMENVVANAHLQRLEHHFGQNPSKIGYAWLNGIKGTYKAAKENKDIDGHWHVKKIKSAYDKEK